MILSCKIHVPLPQISNSFEHWNNHCRSLLWPLGPGWVFDPPCLNIHAVSHGHRPFSTYCIIYNILAVILPRSFSSFPHHQWPCQCSPKKFYSHEREPLCVWVWYGKEGGDRLCVSLPNLRKAPHSQILLSCLSYLHSSILSMTSAIQL